MPRLHLFEFEDQPWFPTALRGAMTGYLAATYRITPFPAIWAERIAKLVRPAASCEIVDLGSGSSGPMPLVMNHLKELGIAAQATLTDLYPNAKHWNNRDPAIRYWPDPVDAGNVPSQLTGIRTMFASFHHLAPESATQILADAFRQRRAICIFEATSRTPAAIATTVLIPLLVLLLTPRVRPISWIQIVFTYLIPILPFLIFWDGLVSQLRTYSPAELADLSRDLRSDSYQWEIGTIDIPRLPAGVPYLIGRPIG